MEPKALIFDFGGTLDTNGTHWSEKFWDVYSAAGVKCSKSEYEKAYVEAERKILSNGLYKMPLKDMLKTSLVNQLNYLYPKGNGRVKSLSGQMTELLYFDVLNTIKEVRTVLGSLKKDYKLGLVSNFYGNLSEVCDSLGLTMFDVMIDSEVVKIRKPNPEIFSLAVKELNLKPNECIVIGDSYDNDIEPAKLIGCRTIWLKGRSWRTFNDISKADYVIHSLKEIQLALKSL
jgi:putative hydrolase of the HAD superfamily